MNVESTHESPTSVLRRFRQKVVRNIYWGGAAGTLVLGGAQAWVGHYGLASLLVVSAVVFVMAALASRRRLLPQGYHFGFVVLTGVAINYSILENGVHGLYWAYPVIGSLFFLFNRRLTIFMVPAVYGTFVISAWLALPLTEVWRFAVSVAMQMALGFTFLVLLRRMQASMTELVVTDPLTRLLNRSRVTEVLNRNIEEFQRYKHPASMVMLDLDHFKALNDKHGHLFGDQMLKQTARRLAGAIRGTDVLFRVGGEEFMVVLPNTDQAAAQTAAEKLLGVIRNEPFVGKTATVSISASAGVAQLREGQQWSQWLTAADTALFQAKHAGRDQVREASQDD